MKTFWDIVMHVVATMPWWLAAFLVGWVSSIGTTHPLKVGLRRFTTVSAENRGLIAWATAALSGFAYAAITASYLEAKPAGALLVAMITGTWSPLAFAGLQRFLRASPKIRQTPGFGWLPDLTGVADWLSGDHGPSRVPADGQEPKP